MFGSLVGALQEYKAAAEADALQRKKLECRLREAAAQSLNQPPEGAQNQGVGLAGPYAQGAASDYYQRMLEQNKTISEPLFGPRITRFDPSTNTRVPVTQEWVDEAVAEIVRLNQELTPMVGEYRADYSNPTQEQVDAANAECRSVLTGDGWVSRSKSDHIWEAVRAASAV